MNKNMKILLLSKNRKDATVLRHLIESQKQCKHSLIVVYKPEAVLERILKEKPNVVLIEELTAGEKVNYLAGEIKRVFLSPACLLLTEKSNIDSKLKVIQTGMHSCISREELSNDQVLSFFETISQFAEMHDKRIKVAHEHELILNLQGEGAGILNEKADIIYANPTLEKMFGVNPGELVGKNLNSFLEVKSSSRVIKRNRV